MKFYPFWARSNHPNSPTAFGFSIHSYDDALQNANSRADLLAQRHRTGQASGQHYGYSDGRPLREEVVETFASDGEIAAVVTRNAYGALILNTNQVFFADIDLPAASKVSRFLWFGKKTVDPVVEALQRISDVLQQHPHLGMRVYRTAAGLRCLGRTTVMQPDAEPTRTLMQSLGSDPLYLQLCLTQKCFRARLTPKPFRMGMERPQDRVPFRSAESEREFRRWVDDYDRRRIDYSTCRFVGDYGSPQTNAVVEPIMELHDHFACNASERLA